MSVAPMVVALAVATSTSGTAPIAPESLAMLPLAAQAVDEQARAHIDQLLRAAFEQAVAAYVGTAHAVAIVVRAARLKRRGCPPRHA